MNGWMLVCWRILGGGIFLCAVIFASQVHIAPLDQIVFLDLSESFYMVDCSYIWSKLFLYGVNNKKLSWFLSYLFKWKKYINYMNQLSEPRTDITQISPGFVLEPLLGQTTACQNTWTRQLHVFNIQWISCCCIRLTNHFSGLYQNVSPCCYEQAKEINYKFCVSFVYFISSQCSYVTFVVLITFLFTYLLIYLSLLISVDSRWWWWCNAFNI